MSSLDFPRPSTIPVMFYVNPKPDAEPEARIYQLLDQLPQVGHHVFLSEFGTDRRFLVVRVTHLIEDGIRVESSNPDILPPLALQKVSIVLEDAPGSLST